MAEAKDVWDRVIICIFFMLMENIWLCAWRLQCTAAGPYNYWWKDSSPPESPPARIDARECHVSGHAGSICCVVMPPVWCGQSPDWRHFLRSPSLTLSVRLSILTDLSLSLISPTDTLSISLSILTDLSLSLISPTDTLSVCLFWLTCHFLWSCPLTVYLSVCLFWLTCHFLWSWLSVLTYLSLSLILPADSLFITVSVCLFWVTCHFLWPHLLTVCFMELLQCTSRMAETKDMPMAQIGCGLYCMETGRYD